MTDASNNRVPGCICDLDDRGQVVLEFDDCLIHADVIPNSAAKGQCPFCGRNKFIQNPTCASPACRAQWRAKVDASPKSAVVSDEQREAILELVELISASAPLSFENAQRATEQILEIVEGDDA